MCYTCSCPRRAKAGAELGGRNRLALLSGVLWLSGGEGQEQGGCSHLLRGEPPHAEHTKDVHSLPMTALKAEEGFLRPWLGYC